jgi:diguanylate cyclase (GGDEF)-like protein
VATGPEVGLSLIYLIPVAAAGWWLGRGPGALLALAATSAGFVADFYWPGTLHSTFAARWNGLTRLVIFVFVAVILDVLRHERERLALLTRTDALTGLANSRALAERLAEVFPNLRRRGAPFAFAYLDLDNFKQVNDRFGHQAGDELLQRVAERMRACVRAGDLIARLGGDEFAVVLWEADPEAAQLVAARLVEEISGLAGNYPGVALGATVGLAHFPEPPADPQQAMQIADSAMYEAKGAGKRRVTMAPATRRTPR